MKAPKHNQYHRNFKLNTVSAKSLPLPPDNATCLSKNSVKVIAELECLLATKNLVSLILLTCLKLLTLQQIASSQLLPDNTLDTENSIVTPQDLTDLIEGGAIRGENLFHSFLEFNVNQGQQVYFANPDGILNILTRVTGGLPSNINGVLGVNGAANLFLLNPNGISFGTEASLDVSGSFFASTAESLVFDNGLEFSATNPQEAPLLTVNITPGLQYGDNPGAIVNQSSRLQVPSGETLAIVGGEVVLENQNLRSRGAQVELGGLAQPGIVEINEDGSLIFPDGVARADVFLNNNARIEVSSDGGGNININAADLPNSQNSNHNRKIVEAQG